MKIKALKNFWSPERGYKAGEEYDVTEHVGNIFIKRGHAEVVKKKKDKNEELKENVQKQEDSKKQSKK